MFDMEIDAALGLLIARAERVIALDDLIALEHASLAHADFAPGLSQLLLIPAATRIAFDATELQAFATRPPIYAPTSRRAFVAQPGSAGFGVSRMFELLKDETAGHILVTTDVADACRHIGLAADTVRARVQGLIGAGWPASA